MSTVINRNFAGGEISPSLYSRVDTNKYQTGLRMCRNFLVARHGGAFNRAGTTFIGEVKDSSKSVRLIPFIFNADQTYVLEFGNLYMRVIKDGAYVVQTAKTITGITQSTQATVTSASHGYSNGDEVLLSDIVGMTQLNGRNVRVSDVAANTFKIKDLNNVYIDTTNYTAYSSGGTAERVFTLTTTYIERDLLTLQFVQSADVITIAHHNYKPREVSRTGDATWAIADITFAPSINPPSNVINNGAPGSTTNWSVTSIATESFEESLRESGTSTTNSSAVPTSGAPITISWDAMTGAQEYNVYKFENGLYGFIGTAGGLTFVDNGIDADTTDTPPIARNPFDLETAKTITGITAANPAVVTTSAAHGYQIGDLVFISGVVGMTQVNNLYFFVRTVPTTTTFSLNAFDGTVLDSSAYTAYSSGGSVQRAHNYPAAVSYFQQRLLFANTRNNPETAYASRTGLYHNFTTSIPLQDDDAVTFTLAGRQVNAIQQLIEVSKFVTLTSGGEWTIEGDQAGILRPTDINPKQHTYNGSGSLFPIVIGGNALYLQARGSIVRDLGFDYQIDGYRGNDLTIFAAHLFDQYSISDWTYAQIPNSIVWAVRNDGTLLGLTYIQEQQIFGWHRHDFEDGTVENVCAIPEGNEDSLYVVVKRTVDGFTKRYVERFNTRQINDIVDSIFVDSALTYDGRNLSATTMTLSGIGPTTWLYTETLALTSSASFFQSSDVGNEIHMTGSDGTLIRFEITGYTSPTVVSGKPNKTVPVVMRDAALADWSLAVDQVSGLWHLEGKTVSVFADGFVVANPHNEAYEMATVENGILTLDKAYSVIHVGLPYTSDIQTLDVDTPQGETISDKRKNVGRVTLQVESSRGIWVGAAPPEDEDSDFLGGLNEVKLRNEEFYDDPVELKTESVEVIIRPEWNSNGRVFVRQTDPLPLAILAIAPNGLFPFQGG